MVSPLVGFGMFDRNGEPTAYAARALAGDRTALRLLVKQGMRAALNAEVTS
jgi:hypothetical protein